MKIKDHHPAKPSGGLFRRFATRTSNTAGSPWAFFTAVAIIAVWAITGPLFHYSDTWQLVINTGTTIVTFLMVFLVQNTQNRDALATHLKLDELIKGNPDARNSMIDLDQLSDAQLHKLEEEYRKLCADDRLCEQRREQLDAGDQRAE